MNQVSQVNMAPATQGPCSRTVSRSWALSRIAAAKDPHHHEGDQAANGDREDDGHGDVRTLGQLTFSNPARDIAAPTSAKTRQAVVLTGMPNPEKPYSNTVSTK